MTSISSSSTSDSSASTSTAQPSNASATASPPVQAGLLVAGIAVAGAAAALVSLAAVAAGASAAFMPITPALYLPFVAAGIVGAYLGWRIVRRFVRPAATALKVIVPVATVLSLVPDVALLALGFIPHSSPTGVVALMLMHLIVVGVAVPLFQRIAPARNR